MKELVRLFKEYTGKSAPHIESLPSSGSNRRYYRLKQEEVSVIGVHGQSREENHAFIGLSHHFHQQGLNTPRVVAVSNDELFYIQEDLGDLVLFDALKAGRTTGVFSTEGKELLPEPSPCCRFQVLGASGPTSASVSSGEFIAARSSGI